MGDGRFNSNITSKEFTVKGHEKADTPIDAGVSVNGYRATITVNVDENATGFVNVKIGDMEANIELKDGVGKFTNTFQAGSYNVELTYLGDDNFNVNATELSFTVIDPVKENTTISIEIGGFETNVTFNAYVNPNATGLIKYEVVGPEHYVLYVDADGSYYVLEEGEKIVCTFADNQVTNKFGTFVKDTRCRK